MGSPHFLHIFGTFDLGGAEARTLALIRAFGPDARHSILVADRGAMSARDAVPDDAQVAFPEDGAAMISGRPTPARLLRIARMLRGPDLILTYAWGAMDVVLAHRLFGRALGLPPLVHHEDGLDPPRTGMADALRVAYRRIAMRGADRIVVPSRALEAFARRRWLAPAGRLVRIANGIAMDGVSGPAPVPTRLPGETLVCTVAGLRPEKNVRRLVRAAAGAGTDIRVAIWGEGPERAAIVAQADGLGCAARVDLLGFVDRPRDHLPGADIFALSSDTEQCPIALIEAMAAGLPVVATDVGDVAVMLAEENRPFVVPPADEAGFAAAIRRLADDPALRATLGRANARKARRDFDADAMNRAYRDLYWSLI